MTCNFTVFKNYTSSYRENTEGERSSKITVKSLKVTVMLNINGCYAIKKKNLN